MKIEEKVYTTSCGEIHYFISRLQEYKTWLVFLPGLTAEYTLFDKQMESFEKEEYCALADHGYRMLAEAVELNLSYALQCPVLLLCGKKDGVGSAKSYNRRWNKCEGHRLVWIEGAGHNANTDAPEVVNQLIESFVREEL